MAGHGRWRNHRQKVKAREKKQFLDQFLVNLLSRLAVIPTYSFPVHSIRLEITETNRSADESRFAQDASLQLDRDAALAIGEYAPGAEVVAGGRIWRSRGIVRRSKEYMPDQYHRICEACGHPEIHLQRQDFGGTCLQCAADPPLCQGSCPSLDVRLYFSGGRDGTMTWLTQQNARQLS